MQFFYPTENVLDVYLLPRRPDLGGCVGGGLKRVGGLEPRPDQQLGQHALFGLGVEVPGQQEGQPRSHRGQPGHKVSPLHSTVLL